MTDLLCPKCSETESASNIRIDCNGEIAVKGIIQCMKCKHEFPFTMFRNYIQKLDTVLPGTQSHLLNVEVPSGIKDDVKEAERNVIASPSGNRVSRQRSIGRCWTGKSFVITKLANGRKISAGALLNSLCSGLLLFWLLAVSLSWGHS